MNRSLVTGLVIGVVVAVAGATLAGLGTSGTASFFKSEPTQADVVRVTPVLKTVRTPREVCHDELVTQTAPTRDPHKVTGTVLGAVVGGVLGNQVGGGDGRKIATAAGAAAGGYAGNRIQDRVQKGNTTSTTERRCTTVVDTQEKKVGYDVRYKLGDEEGQVRMDRDPGDFIPVHDGKLVLEAQGAQ